MTTARRTRILVVAVAASVGALGAGSSAHAAAGALAITSPADQGYINNTREPIAFSGAAAGDTVTLTVMDMTTGTTSNLGSTISGPSGTGAITPATNLPTARDSLVLYETDPLGNPVDETGLATTVYVNTIPTFSGIRPGAAVDSGGDELHRRGCDPQPASAFQRVRGRRHDPVGQSLPDPTRRQHWHHGGGTIPAS